MEAIELTPLGDFRSAKRNPKGHDFEALIASIRRFGFVGAVLCNGALSTKTLVAGHGRVEALRQMQAEDPKSPPGGIQLRESDGEWLVPTISPKFSNRHEAEAYLLADNRITELGAWDNGEELAAMLAEQADLTGTGFNSADIDELAEALSGVAPPSSTVGDVSDIGTRFELVVECEDETSLGLLYDRLTSEGLHCRTLIL